VSSLDHNRARPRSLDVERIRLGVERDLAAAVAELRGWSDRASRVSIPRRDLRAACLLLTEELAPRLHGHARELCALVGVSAELEFYQSPADEPIGACVDWSDEGRGVLLLHGALMRLDSAGLRHVIGHELGHFAAHREESLAAPLREAREAALGRGPLHWGRDQNALAEGLCMASELTADRIGLLASGSLAAALRVELTGFVGSVEVSSAATSSYLAQCRALMVETLRSGERAHGKTHPEHALRAYALGLFAETDVYRDLTGIGPGTRSLEDANALLAALTLPRELARLFPVAATGREIAREWLAGGEGRFALAAETAEPVPAEAVATPRKKKKKKKAKKKRVEKSAAPAGWMTEPPPSVGDSVKEALGSLAKVARDVGAAGKEIAGAVAGGATKHRDAQDRDNPRRAKKPVAGGDDDLERRFAELERRERRGH
jgi:hypothetical protein